MRVEVLGSKDLIYWQLFAMFFLIIILFFNFLITIYIIESVKIFFIVLLPLCYVCLVVYKSVFSLNYVYVENNVLFVNGITTREKFRLPVKLKKVKISRMWMCGYFLIDRSPKAIYFALNKEDIFEILLYFKKEDVERKYINLLLKKIESPC